MISRTILITSLVGLCMVGAGNDARFKRGDEATIYVMEAVEQLEAGKDVSPEYVKPWGCPVKYARDKPKGLKPVGRRPKF